MSERTGLGWAGLSGDLRPPPRATLPFPVSHSVCAVRGPGTHWVACRAPFPTLHSFHCREYRRSESPPADTGLFAVCLGMFARKWGVGSHGDLEHGAGGSRAGADGGAWA